MGNVTEELEAQILAEMEADPEAYIEPVNDIFLIDSETRVISVPASEMLFGVDGDQDVERKYFKCPKIVGDNIDLSAHQIYISYISTKDSKGTSFNNNTFPGLYHCEDIAVDGDCITFSWKLSGNVFSGPGFIAFKVFAGHTENGVLKTKWNTAPAVGTVLMTVPDGEKIAEQYPDIITQLLDEMDAVKEIATPEAMQGYVNEYLEANPLLLDETLTDSTKAAPANIVGDLKSDLTNLENKVNNLLSGGMSADTANLLCSILYSGIFRDEQTANIAKLREMLTNGQNENPDQTGAVLESISATYTGEEVQVGTSVNDLIGLTVTGHYSDGSSKTITGYTISGVIDLGENTVAITYDEKTTTIIVIGVSSQSSATLDTVAYDGKTYRDIFVVGNRLNGYDFENGLPSGLKINVGNPLITDEESYSGGHSIKCFGTSSAQYKNMAMQARYIDKTYFTALKVKVDRYVEGNLGVSANNLLNLGISRITTGWETLSDYVKKGGSTSGTDAYIGSYSSANLDGYIDDVVDIELDSLFETIPNETTMVNLYNAYCDIRKRGED